ncbi:hypothetical protein Cph01nite_12680 [Cellulomonas phragmiteti]|uniref:Uncharacterized protein n=1 Tax=Cellulomonas phragmiteti TaxID=478780 RepID=A0ABQ4DJI4_9CELL|nr:hypothetical protein Cph01nite_12680 [Cellulomonas phragmiteti]
MQPRLVEQVFDRRDPARRRRGDDRGYRARRSVRATARRAALETRRAAPGLRGRQAASHETVAPDPLPVPWKPKLVL